MGSADPLEKMDDKLKSENMQKRACLCYILRAIRAGRCRERRHADHIFIRIHFRMHHFVIKFSKFSSRLGRQGGIDPLTKILRTPLIAGDANAWAGGLGRERPVRAGLGQPGR